MSATEDDDDPFCDDVARRASDERAQRLAEARARSIASGKEPFDLEKLETLCDTSREGRLDSYDVRHARFEEMYYVRNPEVRTLEEFAALVEELNRWS